MQKEPTEEDLRRLDDTPWGMMIIKHHAVVLDLPITRPDLAPKDSEKRAHMAYEKIGTIAQHRSLRSAHARGSTQDRMTFWYAYARAALLYPATVYPPTARIIKRVRQLQATALGTLTWINREASDHVFTPYALHLAWVCYTLSKRHAYWQWSDSLACAPLKFPTVTKRGCWKRPFGGSGLKLSRQPTTRRALTTNYGQRIALCRTVTRLTP